MDYEEPDLYLYDLPQEQLLESSAPIYRRIIAFIIDWFVFNLVFYTPFMEVFQYTSGLRSNLLTYEYVLANPGIIDLLFGVLAASSVIFCFYMALTEYAFGKTIGKQLLGLQVKGKTNIWGYVARNLLKSTLIFLLPFDLLGLFYNNQRLIDKSIRVNVLYTKRISLTEGFI